MYKQALVALDRDEASASQLLKAAKERAEILHILHVLEPHEIQYSIDPTLVGSMTRALQEQALASALARINKLCDQSQAAEYSVEVVLGRPAKQIRLVAIEKQCDVIVLGSHGRHGWQRLLGSTANAVLHGAPIDVFAIRLDS